MFPCSCCPLCLQPYGHHTDACAAPRPKKPEPDLLNVQEIIEASRTRSLEAWLRGGPPLANRGGRPKDELELP